MTLCVFVIKTNRDEPLPRNGYTSKYQHMLNNNNKQKINFAKDRYHAKTKDFIRMRAEHWGVTMRTAETKILTELATNQLAALSQSETKLLNLN